MLKFLYLLFVLERSCICYYIICMIVPLSRLATYEVTRRQLDIKYRFTCSELNFYKNILNYEDIMSLIVSQFAGNFLISLQRILMGRSVCGIHKTTNKHFIPFTDIILGFSKKLGKKLKHKKHALLKTKKQREN